MSFLLKGILPKKKKKKKNSEENIHPSNILLISFPY